jgi:hypothetical protein
MEPDDSLKALDYNDGLNDGSFDTVLEIEKIIKKERGTWAKESIGDKALQSLQKALEEKYGVAELR